MSSTTDLHHWAYYTTFYGDRKVSGICIEKKDLAPENLNKLDEELSDRVCIMPRWWSLAHNGSDHIRRSVGGIITAEWSDINDCYYYGPIESIFIHQLRQGQITHRTVSHKPSGTVSLVGSYNRGIHPPYRNKYIITPAGNVKSGTGKP